MQFISNMFKPAEVTGIDDSETEGAMKIMVKQKSDLGIAIGKGGVTIEKARILLRRYHGLEIGDIIVEAKTVDKI